MFELKFKKVNNRSIFDNSLLESNRVRPNALRHGAEVQLSQASGVFWPNAVERSALIFTSCLSNRAPQRLDLIDTH
jgi:hypothetical protein